MSKAETFSKALEKVTWKNPRLVIDRRQPACIRYHPNILIDAILAKKNLGTHRGMADLTIALGPGFYGRGRCGLCDRNKERALSGKTDREGSAISNTGVPGIIGGYGKERVLHAPCAGRFRRIRKLGTGSMQEKQ